jgi:hypothetical protein
MDNYMFIDYLFKKSESVVMPDTQYRMSTEISKMISKLFYEGKTTRWQKYVNATAADINEYGYRKAFKDTLI